MLQEGDHRHQGMAVQAFPGSPFEVIQPQFLRQLLVGVLADPAGLEGGCQGSQVGGLC